MRCAHGFEKKREGFWNIAYNVVFRPINLRGLELPAIFAPSRARFISNGKAMILSMEKQKIYFPCYGGCEFGSLQEAMNYVQRMSGGLETYIVNIVLYNIRYRDCLRANGIDGVIKMLTDEAPDIVHDTQALDWLKRMWTDRMKEHIADYNIQCLPKNGRICIEGCWFDGLEDIEDQVEMLGNPRHMYSRWYSKEDYKRNMSGLHVGNIWVSYPKFDSFDDADDRSYNNYVFTKEPLTERMMDEFCKQIPAYYDDCMVHEDIPNALLPVLYYNGDSDYVLLASF